MKVIFLDIDGVLNNSYTKEKLWNGFDGIHPRLRDMFLDWIKGKDIQIVLSSTWRHGRDYMRHLNEQGITWITTTGGHNAAGRGWEIQEVLDYGYIDKYAILDDLSPSEFLKKQRPYVVQTSFIRGLEPKKLKKLEKILL